MMSRAQGVRERRALLMSIAADHRRAARAKILDLKARVREAQALRRGALLNLPAKCRAERLLVREKIRSNRLRALARLREDADASRAAAREVCVLRKRDARALGTLIEKARGQLSAEKRYQADLRRIEADNRRKLRDHPHIRAARGGESDDEVRSNLPPELVALFNRVRRSIKGSDRQSRTEAFLHYAEENPAEHLDAIGDKTDALIADLERQQRQARRDMARVPRKAVPRWEPPPAASAASDVPF